MFKATHHNQLPSTLRGAGHYAYLNSPMYNAYWLHALDVAHKLLSAHDQQPGGTGQDNLLVVHHQQRGRETYYQDKFGADFIAALEFDLVERPIQVQEFKFIGSKGLFWRDMPLHAAFAEAMKNLESSPRGSQIHVLREVAGKYMWSAIYHAGGGQVSRLEGGASWADRPTVLQGIEKMLSYEAYLARQQAQREREILANFASIRELNLCVGRELIDVEAFHNGRHRLFACRIAEIYPTGALKLTDGRLKGSGNRFEFSKSASELSQMNLRGDKPTVLTENSQEGQFSLC